MGRTLVTGQKLYSSSVWDRIATDLSSTSKKKVNRKMITSEIAQRWACLPNATREIWETKARM